MGLRAFLIVLAIFGIFCMAKGMYSTCCPSCSTTSIPRMSQAQRDQVMAKRDFLSNLTKNPDLLYNEANQQSVVTLTSEQERQILRNYPDIFTGGREFFLASRTVGTISVPLRQVDCAVDTGPIAGDNRCPEGCIAGEDGICHAPTDCALGADGGTCRFRRATHNRVCEPQLGTKLIMLVRETSGNIVQLVQLDDQNKNQWIFEETCKMSMDGVNICALAERIVRVLFINLPGILSNMSGPSDFDLAEVIIQCCVALKP